MAAQNFQFSVHHHNGFPSVNEPFQFIQNDRRVEFHHIHKAADEILKTMSDDRWNKKDFPRSLKDQIKEVQKCCRNLEIATNTLEGPIKERLLIELAQDRLLHQNLKDMEVRMKTCVIL